MNSITLAVLSGFVVFLGTYITFDYWYQRIWMPMSQVTDLTLATAKDLFVFKTREAMIKIQLFCSLPFAFVFLFFFWSLSPVVGLIIGGFAMFHAWKIPFFYYTKFVRPSRVNMLSVQMVDGLTLMANGLKAGLSVPQALEIVVKELPNPISQEFGQVLNQNQLGTALDVAFEELARRIGSEDVMMFVTSVNILSQTGGNQAETYQNIVKTIRERLKLQGKISAMTAQGMTSAVIVGLLPWGLGAMLYMVDPDKMRPLFTTPMGWAICLMILILEAIGFFVIMKIVNIKV